MAFFIRSILWKVRIKHDMVERIIPGKIVLACLKDWQVMYRLVWRARSIFSNSLSVSNHNNFLSRCHRTCIDYLLAFFVVLKIIQNLIIRQLITNPIENPSSTRTPNQQTEKYDDKDDVFSEILRTWIASDVFDYAPKMSCGISSFFYADIIMALSLNTNWAFWQVYSLLIQSLNRHANTRSWISTTTQARFRD